MNHKFIKPQRHSLFYCAALSVISIAVIGYLGNRWYLSDTGYCFEQKRYLSDEEFIQIAVRSELQNMNIDGSEESISTFQKKNPKCCSINREPSGKSFVNVMLNHTFVDVTLRYEKNAKTFHKNEPFYQAFVSIHSCGKVLDTIGSGAKVADGPF